MVESNQGDYFYLSHENVHVENENVFLYDIYIYSYFPYFGPSITAKVGDMDQDLARIKCPKMMTFKIKTLSKVGIV